MLLVKSASSFSRGLAARERSTGWAARSRKNVRPDGRLLYADCRLRRAYGRRPCTAGRRRCDNRLLGRRLHDGHRLRQRFRGSNHPRRSRDRAAASSGDRRGDPGPPGIRMGVRRGGRQLSRGGRGPREPARQIQAGSVCDRGGQSSSHAGGRRARDERRPHRSRTAAGCLSVRDGRHLPAWERGSGGQLRERISSDAGVRGSRKRNTLLYFFRRPPRPGRAAAGRPPGTLGRDRVGSGLRRLAEGGQIPG